MSTFKDKFSILLQVAGEIASANLYCSVKIVI